MSDKYVHNATGNDGNAGTIGSPYANIYHAVGQVGPGDTVWVRGSIYDYYDKIYETNFATTGTAWSAGNYITVSGYPGETVRIRPIGDSVVRFQGSTIHHVLVKDIILDGSDGDTGDGVSCGSGGHHIRLQNVEVYGFLGNGVIGDISYMEMIDCNVHFNGREGIAYGIYNHSNGVYWTGSYCLIQGGRFWDNESEGIRFGTSSGDHNITGCVVIGAICYRNGYHKGLGGLSPGNGAGIMLADDDNRAINCVCYDNEVGIDFYQFTNKNATGCKAYNCTLYQNQIAVKIHRQSAGYVTNARVKNCIIYDNGTNFSDDGSIGFVEQYNVTSNPGFVDAGGHDYHVDAGSTAVLDVGTDLTSEGVTDDFDGAARPAGHFDVGAYQFTLTEDEEVESEAASVFESRVFRSRVFARAA